MNRLLVVGIHTVAGANLAATFSEKYQTGTWAPELGYSIAGCDALDSASTPDAIIEGFQPEMVIYCGPASQSCWDQTTAAAITDDMVQEASDWALAARKCQTQLVMISSDAVFTGPWMFHDENSVGVCESYQAQLIRATETQICEVCPEALIIRTNVFGWSSEGEQGWIEALLKDIAEKRIVQQDHIRHATPILATDLAEIIDRACQEKLTGIYHVSGAERCNPLKFAQRLADQFDLPWLAMRQEASLCETPQGFGKGECSLQTKSIRKELCVAMPLLSEGLERLRIQAENGHREKLNSPVIHKMKRRVA